MKRLQKGDVLVKARGGASRRARVVRTWRSVLDTGWYAELEALAPSAHAKGRNQTVRRWTVALGEDGLPDGWRRSTVEHDWKAKPNTILSGCTREGCRALRMDGGNLLDGRDRYKGSPEARWVLKCPPCEGKP